MDVDGSKETSMKKLDVTVSSAIRRAQIITRVSDVVRELVDNAIDAGPTRIQVHLDNFGLDKIEVRDDGHGITPSQITLAVAGGHTSKLTNEENLSCGEYYGFRGEALSSICSFANVVIVSRTQKDPHATRYILDDNGKIKGENVAALARGTNIIVRDLFVKYPVRRNYIREKSRMVAELKEIEFYLKSVGLANHKISLVLLHNGSAIWTKPSVTSLDQAICSIFGVGVAKQLTKCGPIEISTPGKNNRSDSVTEIELHLPRLPIDTKIMTTSSNKSIAIIINRRRVQLREIQRMLHQHIMGAILSTTQVSQTKHPITVLKITTPSDQVDFNRDMNKSKVFLMYQVEILEKIEQMLKEFYPVDANLNNLKENLPKVVNAKASNTLEPVTVIPFDPPSSSVNIPTNSRSQNILSFLNEIPASSKENFSKSPVKTPTFPRGNFSASPSSTAPEERLRPGFPAMYNAAENVDSNPSVKDSTSTTGLNFDKDWVLGRLKDQHGNIIENATIVRGTKGMGAFDSASTPRIRRHSSEFTPRVIVPQTQTPRLNPPILSSPTLYPPRNERDKDEDFFTRLRNCHTTTIGNSTVNVNSPYACEPPPLKRSRSSSICSQPLNLNSHEDIFPRRSSQPQTPRQPRQVTLDSLRNWKLPGSTFAKTNSIQSSPAPRSYVQSSVSKPSSVITPRNSGSELFSTFSQQQRQQVDREVEILFPPVMPAAVKAVLGKAPVPKVSAVPIRCPSPDDTLRHLRRSVSVSMLFNAKDLPASSQIDERINGNKVIGWLPGTHFYIVQLEHLMGAFSPWNLLDLVPTLKLKLGIQINSTKHDLVLTTENVKFLADEFTDLSYDDYSEEAVSQIFTVLKDFEEDNSEIDIEVNSH